jgi:predicted nucleotidyltransferase
VLFVEQMNFSAPHEAVLDRNVGRTLAVLAGTTRPLSGREVATLSHASSSTTWRVLRRLADHGLVRVQEVGSGAALLYSLNRDHLAAEPVIALFDLRQRLFERLRKEFGSWSAPPLHASVFGSAARGYGSTRSDIDIFVVGPAFDEDEAGWRAQLDRLSELVFEWTGNYAGVSDVSIAEMHRLLETRPPVIHDLERDAVVVAGPPLDQIAAILRP